MDERIQQLLGFLEEIEKFKVLERRTYTSNLQRKESDADHTWHLVMFVWLFSGDFATTFDLLKVFKLALIHDLAELYAGDPSPFDPVAVIGKQEREDSAFQKLLVQLPADIAAEFADLYEEYKMQFSEESKIVKAYDKVQAMWQNVTSQGKFWSENKITYAEVVNYSMRFLRAEDSSSAVYDCVLAEVKKRNLLQV